MVASIWGVELADCSGPVDYLGNTVAFVISGLKLLSLIPYTTQVEYLFPFINYHSSHPFLLLVTRVHILWVPAWSLNCYGITNILLNRLSEWSAMMRVLITLRPQWYTYALVKGHTSYKKVLTPVFLSFLSFLSQLLYSSSLLSSSLPFPSTHHNQSWSSSPLNTKFASPLQPFHPAA